MANTIATSTIATATGFSPSQLVAMSASGDVLVIWQDGSHVKWSYASSPYSSWTTATLITTTYWQAGMHKLSNDDVLLVIANSGTNTASYLFTYSSGGHSWSVGSPVSLVTGMVCYSGGSIAMDRDAQGRIWAYWENNSKVGQIYYTANTGTSWTQSTTITQSDLLYNILGLAYIGDYIVVITYTAGGSGYLRYTRVDAHDVTIGSWATVTDIPNCIADQTVFSLCLRGVAGSDIGVFVSNWGTLATQCYTASTDTWSTVTNIGATNNKNTTLVSDGTNLYCIWCKRTAVNNFSLVYKKWTTATHTWESSSTQLEADGTNISWPNGSYSNHTLAFVYTVGTGSPWSVNFDTLTIPFTDTRTIPTTAALQATSTRTISTEAALQVTSKRTIASTAALSVIRIIPATVALCTDVSQSRVIEPVTVSLQLNPCHLTLDEDAAYDAFLASVHNQQQSAWSDTDHYQLQCWRNLTDAIALCDDLATDFWRYSIGFIVEVPQLLGALLAIDATTLPLTNDIGLTATYKDVDVRVSQESWEYYMYSVTYAVAYPYYCNYNELRAIYKAVMGV